MNLDFDQNLCKSEPNHAKSHISWITLHTLKKCHVFVIWCLDSSQDSSKDPRLTSYSPIRQPFPLIPETLTKSSFGWLNTCWKNHHVINRFTHLKNDLMPPSCGLSLRRTSMNWSEWTWHQVTPQHISRNTYAITCIPFYVHMYMYIMYMYTYMYTCMYM